MTETMTIFPNMIGLELKGPMDSSLVPAINSDAGLLEQLKSLLPQISKKPKIEEIGLFKVRRNPDPVLAVKIDGQWYELHRWE